jgi:hypothetical protein
MSYKTVYKALFEQLKDSSHLDYLDDEDFFEEFKEPFPQRNYILFMNPGIEEPEVQRASHSIAIARYSISVVGRMAVGELENRVLGDDDFRGILDFTEDIKAAIREDLTFGLDKQGTSQSWQLGVDTFALDSSHRYLTISINGNTPSGYDSVDCLPAAGGPNYPGADIATKMQASLRALVDPSSETGFQDVVVDWDSTRRRFTITSQEYGAISHVEVSAGASNDCSSDLGFDNPTEERGSTIVTVEFLPILSVEDVYPVTFREIPIIVNEEIYVSD